MRAPVRVCVCVHGVSCAGLVEEADRRDEEEKAILQTLESDYVWLPDADKAIPLQLEEAVHSIKKMSRALAERGREIAKVTEEYDALAKQLAQKKAQVRDGETLLWTRNFVRAKSSILSSS